MQKKNKILFLVTIITLGVIFCFNLTIAQTNNNDLTVYEKTYYWGGETLNISGDFQNDIIAAGNNITIDGRVEGDIIAACSNLTINADVKGNIRAAAGNINIAGDVYRNVTIAAGQINISSEANINKDVTAFGGSVQLQGPINGEVKSGAGQININNIIGDNVDLNESGQIILGEKAQILGNLQYIETPDTAAQNIDKTKVKGQIKKISSQKKLQEKKQPKNYLSKYHKTTFWVFYILQLLGLILVGLILASFFPARINQVIDNMYCCPTKNIFRGLLIVFFTPILCIIIMLTIVGLPLGIISLILYGIILYISGALVGMAFGKKLLPDSKSLVGPAFLGIVLFHVIKIIPYIGGIACFILTLWAIGALIRKKYCCKKNNCEVKKPESSKNKLVKKSTAKKTTKTTAKKKSTAKKTIIKKTPKKK